MDYIHVKNLGKYQPGYTDRRHIWAKIYYETFLDEVVQGLCEIDRYRFWSLIIFEVYTQKPVPLTDTNLKIMGWNKAKRRIPLSLQMLHTLVEVRNVESKPTVTQSRVEESRVEENKYGANFLIFWKKYPTRWIPESDKHVKIGKDLAWQQWRKIDDETHQHILTIISQMKSGKAVPDPWRWLRDKKFNDYDPPEPPNPKIEVERKEQQRQKERKEFGKHYRSKTTEELKKDLKSYGCYLHRWLIAEIITEKEGKK